MILRPRHLRRYRQIAEILARHGFGAILAQLDLNERLNLPRRLFRRKPLTEDELSPAKHLRLAFEELGPTFIKLGQILSARSDLLPPEYVRELTYLHDKVTPLSWEPMKDLIEAELEAPIKQNFSHVDPTPIAAASLAQVYAATLHTGEKVVIKVQRLGIDKIINLDLDILYDLAQLMQDRTAVGERFDVADLAEEYAASLKSELDYRREGRNADRFRANFADDPHLHVPKIYWEYTTRRVMVQEYIQGIKIDNTVALDAAGFDRRRLADISARFIIQEILIDGFFHADPHPGNLMILPGDVIGIIDFGTVGRLDSRDRANIARLLIVLVQVDAEGVVDLLLKMGVADYNVDQFRLQKEIRRLLNKYHGLPLNAIPAAEVLEGIEPIIQRHKLRIPSDYWLLIKTMVIMEGVGLGLDPGFDIFETARPYMGQIFRQMYHPAQWGPAALRTATDWSDLVASFPRHTDRILSQLERGNLSLQIGVPDLMQVTDRLDSIVNRLIFGVIVAALIIGLAMLIPKLTLIWPWGLLTWLILLTFTAMIILAMWLLWTIIRTGGGRRSSRKQRKR